MLNVASGLGCCINNLLKYRHQDLSLDILLKLVRVFGSVIYSSLSVSSSVGVDIEAEQRYDWIFPSFIINLFILSFAI